jgi:hypothetical protein
VKRSGLVVIVLFALVMGVVGMLWPTSICPDCAFDPRPDEQEFRSADYRLGCPRCADRKKVSLFNRWTRSDLHPHLVHLLHAPGWGSWSVGGDFLVGPNEFLDQAGRPGIDRRLWGNAQAIWLDDGGEGLVALYAWGPATDRETSYGAAFLFDRDGRLLDELRATGGDVVFHFDAGELPRRELLLTSGYETPPGPYRVRQGGAVRDFPAGALAIRLRAGKLDVVSAEAPR